jgi:L-amino acid N-acyltransferase YncA
MGRRQHANRAQFADLVVDVAGVDTDHRHGEFGHALAAVVMEKRGALKVWTILLAILAFSLSLIGT